MKVYHTKQQYGMISHDITNHCNARCKFCFNDWDRSHPFNMTREVFKKARCIIPLCSPGLFHFSCLYEPTLHPNFFELLRMIPKQYKDKVFFTTNLVKRLSNEEIEAICKSSISYFNISLETFHKETYKKLSGTTQSYFYDNLERLESVSKHIGTTKKIRVITMILRSNYDEILDIVRRVHDEIQPVLHELRTPYVSEAVEKVLAYEMLDREELRILYDKILALGYSNVVVDLGRDSNVLKRHLKAKEKMNVRVDTGRKAPENKAHRVQIEFTGLEKLDAPVLGTACVLRNFSYAVRINSDGTGYFYDTDEFFDLNTIDDSLMFFSRKLLELEDLDAQQYLVRGNMDFEVEVCSGDSIDGALDEIIISDGEYITFRGWLSDIHQAYSGKQCIILLTGQERQGGMLLQCANFSNSCCSESTEKNGRAKVGFVSKIKKDALRIGAEYDFFVGYRDGDKLHVKHMGLLPSISRILRV